MTDGKIDIQLVQLPNGDWIDPWPVISVIAIGEQHRVGLGPPPQVIIRMRGGDCIFVNCDSFEHACSVRDETARRLAQAAGTDRDSGINADLNDSTLADGLRLIAGNKRLMDLASNAVHNFLLEMRDSCTSVINPRFGLAIRNPDGSESSRIRMLFDDSLRMAMKAIAKELRKNEERGN